MILVATPHSGSIMMLFWIAPFGRNGFCTHALVPLAVKLGLDESKFQDCLDTNKYAQHVKDDMSGGSAAGISGTPGSVLIDASGDAQLISGAGSVRNDQDFT